jgi:hypothetical protein
MTPLQLWLEGYKARGESCKQGALVSTVLIAVLGAAARETGATGTIIMGIIIFAGGIVCSALAYLLSGLALTKIAKSYSDSRGEDVDSTKEIKIKLEDISSFDNEKVDFGRWLKIPVIKVINYGNWFGIIEMTCLIVGLIFTVLSLTKAVRK